MTQPVTLIQSAHLIALYDCSPVHARHYALWLDEACWQYGIVTPERIRAFLAQVGHESGRLRHTREIWGPTPAQIRYEGRADLGNTQPGDGKRFMGRGLIQITGRANYAQASDALGEDFIAFPALLETPKWASRSAAWYWQSRGLNALADAGDYDRITRRINGGLTGRADRIALLERAEALIG